MTKGTSAHGKKKRNVRVIHCRRCGRRSFFVRKKKCSSCGFGSSARMRKKRFYKKDFEP